MSEEDSDATVCEGICDAVEHHSQSPSLLISKDGSNELTFSVRRPDDQTVDSSVVSHGGSRQYGLEQASNDSSDELRQVDELLQDTNGKIDSVKVLLACGDTEANKKDVIEEMKCIGTQLKSIHDLSMLCAKSGVPSRQRAAAIRARTAKLSRCMKGFSQLASVVREKWTNPSDSLETGASSQTDVPVVYSSLQTTSHEQPGNRTSVNTQQPSNQDPIITQQLRNQAAVAIQQPSNQAAVTTQQPSNRAAVTAQQPSNQVGVTTQQSSKQIPAAPLQSFHLSQLPLSALLQTAQQSSTNSSQHPSSSLLNPTSSSQKTGSMSNMSASGPLHCSQQYSGSQPPSSHIPVSSHVGNSVANDGSIHQIAQTQAAIAESRAGFSETVPLSALLQEGYLKQGDACLSITLMGVRFVSSLLKDGTVSSSTGEKYKLPTHWVNACWEKLGHKGKKMKRAGVYKNIYYNKETLLHYCQLYNCNTVKKYLKGSNRPCSSDSSQQQQLNQGSTGQEAPNISYMQPLTDHRYALLQSNGGYDSIGQLLADCKVMVITSEDLCSGDSIPSNFWSSDMKIEDWPEELIRGLDWM